MENFEKCTVAMLGGPCSQHVTGNTSRLNQPPSAIMAHQCTFGEKIVRIKISQFYVIKINHRAQVIIDIAGTTKMFFII